MVSFDASTHTYTIGAHVVPSVSAVCDLILGSCYGDVPEDVLQAAADFGTEIHEAIEWFNGMGEEPDFDCPKKIHCFSEWVRLKEKHGIQVIEQEVMGDYQGLYAGRFDMIGREGDKTYLYDYKTSYTLHEDRVSLQLSLYRLMYGWDRVDGIKAVWLPKRKKGLVKELPSWDMETLKETINCVLNVQSVPADLKGEPHGDE